MNREMIFERLQEALLSEDGFLIKLRMLDGFDERKFSELCKVLEDCTFEYRTDKLLPKELVSLLFEICPTILTFMDNNIYCKQDEQWNKKIWDAYTKVYDLVLDCCL